MIVMKMEFHIAAIILGLGTLGAAAARTFTSSDGKTIQAEIIEANGLQATLKLTDGRQTVVPLNRLSQQDQDFVAGWVKQNPQAVQYNFVIEVNKDKLESKPAKSSDSLVKATATQWLYHIKVMNRASQPVEGLKLRYQIHYTDVEGTSKSTEVKSGIKDVPDLKPGASAMVDTDPVELVKTQLEGGFTYASGAKSRQTDTIKGIAVTLEHRNKSVYEFTTGGVKKISESASSTAAKTPKR